MRGFGLPLVKARAGSQKVDERSGCWAIWKWTLEWNLNFSALRFNLLRGVASLLLGAKNLLLRGRELVGATNLLLGGCELVGATLRFSGGSLGFADEDVKHNTEGGATLIKHEKVRPAVTCRNGGGI